MHNDEWTIKTSQNKQTKTLKILLAKKLSKLNEIKIGFNIFQMISYFRLGFNFGFQKPK